MTGSLSRERVAELMIESGLHIVIDDDALCGRVAATTVQFAALVRADALEEAAKVCDELGRNDGVTCAEEIRAIGAKPNE